MKVLHVISSGGMYGAEAVILSLMAERNRTEPNGCALAIFHKPDGPPPMLYEVAQERGFNKDLLHLISCRGQFDRSVPAQLRALASGFGAEVVHTHGYKADIYAAIAWRGKRPALVSTCHTWYDNDFALRLYGAADRWVLRRFDAVVAVSEEVRARLLAAHVPAKCIWFVRNGVDLQRFAVAVATRKRSRPADGRLRVGLVGRLAPEKGIDIFLHAAALVLQCSPEISFTVAGDGPERTKLQEVIANLHLQGKVTLLGRQGDMAAFYSTIDLLVSSSFQEGLPIALLEGMASGLPIVATRVGAVPDLVLHEKTGLLVEAGQPAALAAAILRFASEPVRGEEFGRAGQQYLAREFSAERMNADYLQVYDQALITQRSSSCLGRQVQDHA